VRLKFGDSRIEDEHPQDDDDAEKSPDPFDFLLVLASEDIHGV
jgi:hypothetical protein